jgi:hypothetical protein
LRQVPIAFVVVASRPENGPHTVAMISQFRAGVSIAS